MSLAVVVNEKQVIILEAALRLFMQYGFKRVKMQDIADASNMSRPALYLEFPNKEAIFDAIIRDWGKRGIAEIRADLVELSGLEAKLILVFDIWTVRPFELIGRSPDAADLFDSSLSVAREAVDTNFAAFVELLNEILKFESDSIRNWQGSIPELAYFLATSVKGHRMNAKNTKELRSLIQQLVGLLTR